MAVVKPRLTPADVDDMVKRGEIDPDAFFELVNGEIVWLTPAHSPQPMICMLIGSQLVPFAQRIGAVVLDSSAGFMVGPGHQQLRGPDVSLVTKERRHTIREDGWNTEAPDLAVEVLSEGQFGEGYAVAKIDEYLQAGGKVVWLVDPRSRTVRVHERNRSEYLVYSAEQDITLDQIAPGFRCRVSEFFPEETIPAG
ncbi:MAG: Uma2 family endonuclease [Chloroflexota bacterium]|nr:Uma2 family endonuclease [Chloroflexota bacterium]